MFSDEYFSYLNYRILTIIDDSFSSAVSVCALVFPSAMSHPMSAWHAFVYHFGRNTTFFTLEGRDTNHYGALLTRA